MKKKLNVVNIHNYTYKPTIFLDESSKVDDSTYTPYEHLIALMIAKNEISFDELRQRSSLLKDVVQGNDGLSIEAVKGVDGFDVDTHYSRIRRHVYNEFKKLQASNEENDKKIEADVQIETPVKTGNTE